MLIFWIVVGNQGGPPALALAPASASPQDQGRGGGRSPSTGQAGGRCRRVRRVRGIGAVGASPRGQAIPVTRRVRAVGASDPLPRGQAILRTRCVRALGASGASLGAKQFQERAGSALRASDPPARGQAISWRARGPVTVDVCGRGLYGALPSQSEATKPF